MASIVAGAVINSISFNAAGFLFSKLNHPGYEAEMKRHNHALEELARAKEKWYESEVAEKDYLAELRRQLSDANADINTTNQALDRLRIVLRREEASYQEHLGSEPVLSDYYKPSPEMREYQTLVVGASDQDLDISCTNWSRNTSSDFVMANIEWVCRQKGLKYDNPVLMYCDFGLEPYKTQSPSYQWLKVGVTIVLG